MNYFTRIRKSLLLVLISLFVQSCKKVCIKSNDFGEQSNVDLFKISARDLSECVFDETSSSSSYDELPSGGMLQKCMEGYEYDEDTNEYSAKPKYTVAALIGYGYFDLGNSSDTFNSFKNELAKEANKTLHETFEGYYCKDFDYLTDQESNFIKAFKGNETVIKEVDLIELNKRIYQQCGNYCSNVCSGSLSTNNSSIDAATFSQLSWPHSSLKSSGSYYGITFKNTSNFKITATGSIQTNGMKTSINGSNGSILVKNNPYLPSYNLGSDSVWKTTDKLNLFAKVEAPKNLYANENELLSRFYLDFVNFSDTKLQSIVVPIECDNADVNMPNYVQKVDKKNVYSGPLVFAEPKYSSVYCDYSNTENICTFKVDYTKLLRKINCLSSGKYLDNADQFNNLINVESFNDMQKDYYKYAVNALGDAVGDENKQFVLSQSVEKVDESTSENIGAGLKYYEYTYEDNNGKFVLQYEFSEGNPTYAGQRKFEFGNELTMPFKVYIAKSDEQDSSDTGDSSNTSDSSDTDNSDSSDANNDNSSNTGEGDSSSTNKDSSSNTNKNDSSNINKCKFQVSSKNTLKNFIKNKTGLPDAEASDISYDEIGISEVNTWYPVTQDKAPAVLNEYYSSAMSSNNTSVVTITTSDAGCFDKLVIKIVPLREIQINKTGFLFFRNVLGDTTDNKIKFQVINPDLNTIMTKINESKNNAADVKIKDYETEIRSNYFEYYKYNKTRTDPADAINDTFTTIEAIKAEDLKNLELLGTKLKENIEYGKIFKENAIFVRAGQVVRFDDSNWIDTSNLTIKTKSYDSSDGTGDEDGGAINIANNIDLIYFIKERPALMCLTDKFSRDINILNACSDAAKKNLFINGNNSEAYLCNLEVKKEKIEKSDNKDCYIYISETDSEWAKFASLKYLVAETTDDNEQKATEQKVSFKKDTETKTNYISVAEMFNTTLQSLYSVTDFLEAKDFKSKAVTVAKNYKGAIGELKTKFNSCLKSGIFVTKNIEYDETTDIEDISTNEVTTVDTTDIGYLKLDASSLGTYLTSIETALDGLDALKEDNTALKTAMQNNNETISKENGVDLNKNNKVPFSVSFLETTNSNSKESTCEEMFPIKETDSPDEKEQKEKQIEDCKENKEKVAENKESNADKPIVSFSLTLSDDLEDDGCNLTTGLCTQELTTCLDFSNYFGSVYNFNDIIKINSTKTATDADSKNTNTRKFSYCMNFVNDSNNLITGFNISGAKKNGGDLTTLTTSNSYDEENDKENVINCSSDSSLDCYNKYKMTNIIVSDNAFPRLLELKREFLFPENNTTVSDKKTLSFKITSQDKKTSGENLAVFVGPADNLYDVNENGNLCIANGGQDCKEGDDNNIFWLIGYDSLKAQNGKLNLRENNPFKFDVNGQLVKVNGNSSIIKANDVVSDYMVSQYSSTNGYNLAFFFKILDEDGDDSNNSGFYTIKITELSDGAMEDIMQNWFERRQALNDSSINFKLEEPVSVVNLLFNSILGIMDGESYGVRSDKKKCDKTLAKLKADEEICFIHGYDKNDSLNGKSCGTDGIDGYSVSSDITEKYCLQSCDQIGVNEIDTKCNIVYNNGGLLKLLYVNIIQNTLYQFIVKIALVLMLTLYGFGYFLGLSEFNQKEIMTRILRACFIYALISNTGWALYDKFVVSFFKQGIDSLLFLIASSFEVSDTNYIEEAILQNDYSVKMLLFSSTFANIKMLFSEAVLYKILGLIFSGWLGILYAYLVLTGLITYIVGMFNAIALYLMAQMFMSITLSIGPMIFLLMFFERTKGSFDNWLSILIGFALQEVFIIITVSFFNNLISSIIKTVFAYPVCILPILDINLLGVPLSILQFWKVPGTGFSGNILDLQNQAGPSFYSILLFYIVANLSNKFVTEMADLGNDIGDGIKATDIASGVTGAITNVGNSLNKTIGGVASAPYTRAIGGFNNFVKGKSDAAKKSMQDKFDALNEARISPIKDDLEDQLKRGTYKDKNDGLIQAYEAAHKDGATREAKKEYRKKLDDVAKNQRLEKLIKNENLDKAARKYFKEKGIDIDEKNKDGSDKYSDDEKREFKEYFLNRKGYINKDSMDRGRRKAVSGLVKATNKVKDISNLDRNMALMGDGIAKKFGGLRMKKGIYDEYSKAFAEFKGNNTKQKAEDKPLKPQGDDSNGQDQNHIEPNEQQPQKPSENGGAVERTVDRNIPQDMDEVNEDVMRFKEDTRGASED